MNYSEYTLPATLSNAPVWIIVISASAVACYHAPTRTLFEESVFLPADISGAFLYRLIIRAFRTVCKRIPLAYKKSGEVDAHTLILVDAPWAEVIPFNAESIKTHSAPVTRDALITLVQQSYDRINKDLLKHNRADIDAVASEVVSVRLNGYPTEIPLGKEAKTISIDVVTVAINKAFRKELIREVTVQLHTHSIVWGSYFLEHVRMTTYNFSLRTPAAIIQWGATGTQCMFWDGVACTLPMTYPIGAYSFLDQCRADLRVDRITARSYIAMMASGDSGEALNNRLKKSIQNYHDTWLRTIYEYFHGCMKQGLLLREIYFCTDGTVSLETIMPDGASDMAGMQSWWPALGNAEQSVVILDRDYYGIKGYPYGIMEALTRNRFSL